MLLIINLINEQYYPNFLITVARVLSVRSEVKLMYLVFVMLLPPKPNVSVLGPCQVASGCFYSPSSGLTLVFTPVTLVRPVHDMCWDCVGLNHGMVVATVGQRIRDCLQASSQI